MFLNHDTHMQIVCQAMIQFEMIQEGDRLLLGLSGGKDSLTLLHCLLEFQKKLPIKFDLEVMIMRAPLIKLLTNI